MLDSDTSLDAVLPLRTRDRPVAGRNLRPGTLADQLGGGSTLLVFLPDLEADVTRAVVGDLHLATDLWGDLAPTIFVHGSSPGEGDALFRRLHPGARVVADPSRRLFDAFGLGTRRAPRFSSMRAPSRPLGAAWVRGDRRPVREGAGVPILVHLEGSRVSWIEPYGVAGVRPEVDRILRLARVVARARGNGRAA